MELLIALLGIFNIRFRAVQVNPALTAVAVPIPTQPVIVAVILALVHLFEVIVLLFFVLELLFFDGSGAEPLGSDVVVDVLRLGRRLGKAGELWGDLTGLTSIVCCD